MLLFVAQELGGPLRSDALSQQGGDIRFVQRIQPEHDQLMVGPEPPEGSGIILAQPLASPARETETRVTETLQ